MLSAGVRERAGVEGREQIVLESINTHVIDKGCYKFDISCEGRRKGPEWGGEH